MALKDFLSSFLICALGLWRNACILLKIHCPLLSPEDSLYLVCNAVKGIVLLAVLLSVATIASQLKELKGSILVELTDSSLFEQLVKAMKLQAQGSLV